MKSYDEWLDGLPECAEGSPCKFGVCGRCQILKETYPAGSHCPFHIPPAWWNAGPASAAAGAGA